ncbi:MAG TPA: 50S ribosomal protein L3 [Planctomycetota bacterium]|nr:50S ribosomal protein L3 [Planctomycetota bacterium]HRR81411.1 50S ribosomal protein L3 [Planctomycetota bacterium]HRT94750.1 50S ribosomal protein L3 [Planctomycetota bacterium]
MVPGLLGKKLGMTQLWDKDEVARAATVLELGPCVVLQVKTPERDGYSALQLGFDTKKTRRKHGKGERRKAIERRGANRAEIGHARAAGTTPRRFVREVPVEPGHPYQPGQELTVEMFADVTHVDIVGTSKGKGFQGTVKRHHFSRGPVTHGSMNVRQPGSIGSSAAPSRVIPGRRMAGHMGDRRQTEQNLRVLGTDPQRNLLLVCGAVPGAADGYVIVTPAQRLASKKSQAHRALSLMKTRTET